MARRHATRVGKVTPKKATRSKSGRRTGARHSAKPNDLRVDAPSGEVVVRRMTDEDRALFEARRRSRA